MTPAQLKKKTQLSLIAEEEDFGGCMTPLGEILNTEYDHDLPTFQGSRVFVDEFSRIQMPVLRPEHEFKLWDIIKRVIGSRDITKVSLPVILNEPLSGC